MAPVEISDREVFKKIAESAIECRVYKDQEKKVAKVKARTKSKLVTIKIPIEELTDFLKELKCQNMVEL